VRRASSGPIVDSHDVAGRRYPLPTQCPVNDLPPLAEDQGRFTLEPPALTPSENPDYDPGHRHLWSETPAYIDTLSEYRQFHRLNG
jgi:hypothetical protein